MNLNSLCGLTAPLALKPVHCGAYHYDTITLKGLSTAPITLLSQTEDSHEMAKKITPGLIHRVTIILISRRSGRSKSVPIRHCLISMVTRRTSTACTTSVLLLRHNWSHPLPCQSSFSIIYTLRFYRINSKQGVYKKLLVVQLHEIIFG